ncbi:hypothetical protein DVH24_040821 [Malus domestica]|uniref:Threonyl/alanyl tRNA synthetase SAD domain-containing protein n=1 Tax=Malus domestica TaxID=3750 RepID=A0A498IC80_MALDO|nr:hypothetical protein DVH24_040821 [Malus domestica]
MVVHVSILMDSVVMKPRSRPATRQLDETINVYSCCPKVDLCYGPHISNTSFVKAFAHLKVCTCFYWILLSACIYFVRVLNYPMRATPPMKPSPLTIHYSIHPIEQ